jgi:midasin (ATPase involved in ribosome maturation)
MCQASRQKTHTQNAINIGNMKFNKLHAVACRGRFLELHVEELPDSELSDILHQRCGIAPTYASKMVTVLRELQRRRQRSNVFAGRHGFITPRDLFRWAERGAVGYEALAVDGFCVLGERLRSAEERSLVVEVLESVLRVKLDMEQVGFVVLGSQVEGARVQSVGRDAVLGLYDRHISWSHEAGGFCGPDVPQVAEPHVQFDCVGSGAAL